MRVIDDRLAIEISGLEIFAQAGRLTLVESISGHSMYKKR